MARFSRPTLQPCCLHYAWIFANILLTSFLLDVTGLGDTFFRCPSLSNFERIFMKPVSRHAVNKHRSSRAFQRNTRTVAKANLGGPMRGGWRL